LVAAASQVIARDGIDRATTRWIADEAGVPPGLVHYWFANKDELIEAVIDDTLLAPVALAVAEASTPDGRADLLSRLQAVLAVLASDDRGSQIATFELTTMMLRRPDLHAVACRHYTAYRELGATAAAEAAAARGVPLPAPPFVVGTLVASLVDGLFLAWLADPEGTDVEAVLQLLNEMILTPDAPGTQDGQAAPS
jgi:AcrR family transcriptional regulator